ncbi:MAG: hypothetical protein JST87_09745 [Bacteroidetes bacterium]|nr:hypothetical protein [Bacteroidota bacterium]
MRKAIADARSATCRFTEKSLKYLRSTRFKFVQVKALTSDNHYDYVEPNILLLVPIKEIESNPNDAGIYTSLDNEVLEDWAKTDCPGLKIVVSLPKGKTSITF